MHLENLGILFGLVALAIPVILHLLRRRRHEVVDWAAMQFLPVNISIRQRRWLDELLLMLLRMGLLALLVIGLASPVSTSSWLAPLADHSTRDSVLVFDGSYSMDVRVPNQASPWEEALQWARTHVDQAGSGDRFAVMIARQPPLVWLDEFSDDLDEVRGKLDTLPLPRGNPDLPRALTAAWQHLQTHSTASRKEIIVLTDQQHFGWADLATLSALEKVGDQWHADGERVKTEGLAVPSLRVVKLGAPLPKSLSNYFLEPLLASSDTVRVGETVTLRSSVHLNGSSKWVPPRRVTVAVNGEPLPDLALAEGMEGTQGGLPLSFQHRFDQVGRYVLSLTIAADAAHDALAADNAQHTVVEVVNELPILLVDGDSDLSAESSTYILRQALASRKTSAQAVKVVPHNLLTPAMIVPEAADSVKPAVIVLADVPYLSPAQIEALDRFVAAGGGLFVVAGARVAGAKAFYNDALYRQGQGWLPVKLSEVGAASEKEEVRPEPSSFQHPALAKLRQAPAANVNAIRFAHWWKVVPSSQDSYIAIAGLSNGDPFLLEKTGQRGRVILCTVPLDRHWGSTFPTVGEFVVFARELIAYLADHHAAAAHLQNGAPIRLVLSNASLPRLTIHTPEAHAKSETVKSWPWVFDNTGAIGVYRVEAPGPRSWPYVVAPDLRESNLTRCTENDWQLIRERLQAAWPTEPSARNDRAEGHREELWWLLLLAVVGLLCLEVWMTRRMVVKRGLS